MSDKPNSGTGYEVAAEWRDKYKTALAELNTLRAELERWKRGELTEQEFHGLCHHLDEKRDCSLEEFDDGCADYQTKLFGKCMRDALRADNDRLRAGQERLQRTHDVDCLTRTQPLAACDCWNREAMAALLAEASQ